MEQLYLFTKPVDSVPEFTSARTSLRLLTRILPFIFEDDDDGFVEEFFFKNRATQLVDPKLAPELFETSEGSLSSSSSASSVDEMTPNLAASGAFGTASTAADSQQDSKRAGEGDEGFRPVLPSSSSPKSAEEGDDQKEGTAQGKGKTVIRSTIDAEQPASSEPAPSPAQEGDAPSEKRPITARFPDLTVSDPPKPFYQLLVSTLFDLMFQPGFCVPQLQIKQHREKVNAGQVGLGELETDLLW